MILVIPTSTSSIHRFMMTYMYPLLLEKIIGTVPMDSFEYQSHAWVWVGEKGMRWERH